MAEKAFSKVYSALDGCDIPSCWQMSCSEVTEIVEKNEYSMFEIICDAYAYGLIRGQRKARADAKQRKHCK